MGQETIKCCTRCNSALGGRLLEIEDRIAFLIKYYTIRHKLDTPIVQWDEEELNDLGRNLKQKIKKLIELRKRGEAKIMYLRYLDEYICNATC